MSAPEIAVANGMYGWHGLEQSLLFAPINIVRSAIFFVVGHHGQYLTRLPNALFGMTAVIGFGWLLYLWHGLRTALFGTVLFACSAWTLHVSRVATNDVVFLWAMILLLVSNAALHRYAEKLGIIIVVLLSWVALLFVPGMIWLIIVNIFWQRTALLDSWQAQQNKWVRSVIGFGLFASLVVLLGSLFVANDWIDWLGFPHHVPNPLLVARDFFAIPFHLYFHGPLLPNIWLGRLPILDVFTAITSVIGLYFYVRNYGSGRSKVLASFFIISLLLIAIGGSVSISLVIPLFFGLVATGIAYLLREWLRVFPINPIARGFGMVLIITLIGLSCMYNLRSYFVAWPHYPSTQIIYRYHR
jgi:hypothetical protein